MKTTKILSVLTALLFSLCINAQNDSKSIQYIVPGTVNANITWTGKEIAIPIKANNKYTISTSQQWVKVKRAKDGKRILVTADTTFSNKVRTANIVLKTEDGIMTRTIVVTQEEEKSYETIFDNKVTHTFAKASTYQASQAVDKLFDGNMNSLWQSSSFSSVSESKPAVLTITFSGQEVIDYMVYFPRTDGSESGIWTTYAVKATMPDGTTIEKNITKPSNTNPDTVRWEGGITPQTIEITITSGTSNKASGAELTFYRECENKEDLSIFADDIYSVLREGVTQEDINALKNPFCKNIASGIFNGTYKTAYRAASYPCRLSPAVLSDEWNAPGKNYSYIDNPTGINVRSGNKIVMFVSGIPSDIKAQLCITAWYNGKDGQHFDGAYPHFTNYDINNGFNIFTYDYAWDGLAYIKYFANTRARYEAGVPNINIHFINGEVNGILTPDKTNEEMYNLCNKAATSGNICIDVFGKKVQSVWTSAGMRDYCKADDGTSLGYRQYINLLDSLIAWEHRQIGFEKYNRIPNNHTLAYTNYQYYMYQGGDGVAFHHDQEKRVLNCKTLMYNDYDAIWGLSHEWGHQHQMHPYITWGGMSEVSNNIFSYYNVQHMGYVVNISTKFATYFWKHNFYDYTSYLNNRAHSRLRHNAYEAAIGNSSLYSYSADMRNACLAEIDSTIYRVENDSDRSVGIFDTKVSVVLAPFNLLGNYATIYLNYPDFYPDLFEALRQQNNLPSGSTIEKQGSFDKYELISASQNGNTNGLYSTFRELYPNSYWITENYLNEGKGKWQDNSIPFLFNFIRKASRLYGYNLYRFFERAGFLRLIAIQQSDYGIKYSILTKKMRDEFEADMKALEDDGTLKPLTDQMLYDIFYCRNFNESDTDKIYPTPKIAK